MMLTVSGLYKVTGSVINECRAVGGMIVEFCLLNIFT
jgi:hypothetical protein